jgi:hypothetical protein
MEVEVCNDIDPHRKHPINKDPVTCMLPLHHAGPHEADLRYPGRSCRVVWGYPPPPPPAVLVRDAEDGSGVEAVLTDPSGQRIQRIAVSSDGKESYGLASVTRKLDAMTVDRETFGQENPDSKRQDIFEVWRTASMAAGAYEQIPSPPYKYESASVLPSANQPLKDPKAFDSWIESTSKIFQPSETYPPTEREEAWALIKLRVEEIETRLGADHKKASAPRISYIKNTAILLSMRAVMAALNSLSELISA